MLRMVPLPRFAGEDQRPLPSAAGHDKGAAAGTFIKGIRGARVQRLPPRKRRPAAAQAAFWLTRASASCESSASVSFSSARVCVEQPLDLVQPDSSAQLRSVP